MRTIGRLAIVAAVFVLIGVCVVLGYAKTYGFSARGTPSRPEKFLAHRLLDLSVPNAAKTAVNPVAANPENIAAGKQHYLNDCAVCHGDDGAGKTETAAGLYPKVPNLRHEGDMSDGQLFYTIRNGVRFTGMPGWSEPDEELWKVVLFIRDLPNQPSGVQSADTRNPKH